jgi:predicted transcriptional regulator
MRQGSPPIFSCDAVPGGVTILRMAPTQRPLTVQLPGELAEALRNYALVTNTPVNQVINAALADYLEANAADVVHAAFDKGLQQHGEAFDRLANLWLRC